jgi:16S rRNA (cytosine1402-N4)-methyltransferase
MHIPVLLDKVIEYLNPQPGQNFIDATIDGGGHALAILERIIPDGKLLGIEWDEELLGRLKLKIQNSKFKNSTLLVNDSYANLKKIAAANGFENVKGIIFDLGMSSWHLEEAGRGFSFMKDEPLDMRFGGGTAGAEQSTAREIINTVSEQELIKILKEYGEERFAKPIAEAIITARKTKPIISTFQLVEIIKSSTPFWYRRRRIHFATKTFQALRIAVNGELENLKSGIEQAGEILDKGGRMAVISFHSLEDRIVKNFLREEARAGRLKILTKKPVRAELVEVTTNPRARSAKLRVAERVQV